MSYLGVAYHSPGGPFSYLLLLFYFESYHLFIFIIQIVKKLTTQANAITPKINLANITNISLLIL